MAKTVKRNVRFDSHHVRLKKGETEKQKGGYEYRWTTPMGYDTLCSLQRLIS